MSRRSRAAGHWLNWMIDEPPSIRWSGFQLNSPSIESKLIVPPPTSSSPALQVIFHHFSTPSLSIFTSLSSSCISPPPPTYLRHVDPSLLFLLSICFALSCTISLSFTFSSSPPCYPRLHQVIVLFFFGFQSALSVHFLPPSESNFLASPSLCVSLQAANGE